MLERLKKLIIYMCFVFKHKYYVLVGCRIFHVPILMGIFHDWDKFLYYHWSAYYMSYVPKTHRDYLADEKIKYTILEHKHKHKHHWEHWVLLEAGQIIPMEIPEIYIREMLADWYGAGMANFGRNEVIKWYFENKPFMRIHPNSTMKIEILLHRYM